MEINEFCNCCGAVEVGSFWGLEELDLSSRVRALENSLKDYYDGEDGSDLHGCVIATTSGENSKIMTAALAAWGMKEMLKFVNPKTGNTVTLWAKAINQK